MTEPSHKMTFFRQSGWMMIAVVVSGFFALLVHTLSKIIPETEYAALNTLIPVLIWMSIPGLGLQMVFAQQASSAVTDAQRRQLVGTVKAVMTGTFCIWLGMVVLVYFKQASLVAAFKLSSPASLWLTVCVALTTLWLPIVQGLLQGRQNFLWLGWVAIFNGVGRVLIAALIVILLHGWAAGIMAGFLIGSLIALGAGAWQNRDFAGEPGTAFDAAGWLKRVIPLTLGIGAYQILLSADAIVVQNNLGDEGHAAPYLLGGTLARAIVLFTGPLAAVMFPKLVHSAAHSKKHNFNLLGLTLLGTAILGAIGAIGLSLFSSLIIQKVSRPEFAPVIVPLMPLYAWSMVPLAVANVLLNQLMAHSRFKIVPVLIVLAIGYWVALEYHHDSIKTVTETLGLLPGTALGSLYRHDCFKTVIETLGIFSLFFLLICSLFALGSRDQAGAATTV